ncbi:MAG TPA: hypothetical protein VFG59_16590 [Anaeromyxobacter sp.]|nr:hypothetical protein [Anaeromyxobacter sp.]
MDSPLRRTSLNALRPWVRSLLVSSAWSLLVSGLIWLPVHYLYGSGAGEVPPPLEPWLMRWHGLAMLIGLYALGAISATHVPRGWALRRQRPSGAILLAGWAVLAGSGWALYYLPVDDWRPWLGTGHALVGVAVFLVGLAHDRRRRGTRS